MMLRQLQLWFSTARPTFPTADSPIIGVSSNSSPDLCTTPYKVAECYIPNKTSLNCANRELPAREPAGPLAAMLTWGKGVKAEGMLEKELGLLFCYRMLDGGLERMKVNALFSCFTSGFGWGLEVRSDGGRRTKPISRVPTILIGQLRVCAQTSK